MTLNQIMSNIQHGEEYTKFQIIKESVERNYDEQSDIFYASARIKELAKPLVLTESEESKIGRLVAKISSIETRMENGKIMSDAYRKMQASAIMEDCKAVFESVENLKKVDSNKVATLSKIVGTAKYFVENNIDDAAVLAESKNPLINKYIKEEENAINQIL